MRVLTVTPSYPRFPGDFHGGFVRDLCVELHRRGVGVEVLAPRTRTLGRVESPFPVKRFPYLPVRRWETLAEETLKGAPPLKLLRLPAYLASAFLHLEASDADVIHSHLAIPLGWVASYSRRGTPKVVTCHGSDCTLPLDNPAYRPFAARALRTADKVVAVSDHVRTLAERLGGRRAVTIYNGVDAGRFKPDPSARRRSGLRERGFVVGTLGRLVPEKRVGDLIDAAAILQSRVDLTLLIGGAGPDEAALREKARRAGVRNIEFTGVVSHPERFYPLLDVFVLTSTREGLSTSLREAMASGCACVAVRGSGSEEAIRDGVDGILCDPESPPALAEAILEAAESRGLGREARRTVIERFSLSESAERYVEVYREVSEGRSA